MEQVPEESTAWLTITFKDKDGEDATPESAEYRIDSSRGEEIRDWTNISGLSSEYELTLVPDDNKIVDDVRIQRNIVTIKSEFGDDDERNEEYEYKVENLNKIPKE